jgi:hypothetical protein
LQSVASRNVRHAQGAHGKGRMAKGAWQRALAASFPAMPTPPFPFRRAAAGLAVAAAACGAPPPPQVDAEFVLSAGDSAVWVAADSANPRVRRAPLWIVRVDNRWVELYVTDDDRSHRNAVFVGQHLWARDLMSGDSSVLAADTAPLLLERRYAAATPWDPRLRPEDEPPENPVMEATTDLVPLDLVGPYVGLELRSDVETADSTLHRHEARRGTVDLRAKRRVSLAEILGADAGAVVEAGERQWRRARDSVRATQGEDAAAAGAALDDFPFDPSSFSLVAESGEPAVAFTSPGRGTRSGGYVLPLAPVAIGRPAWWTAQERATIGVADSAGVVRWTGPRYVVEAVPDADGERASLVVRAEGRAPRALGSVPLPVRRVWRLDDTAPDPAVRRALARAFDEAGLYGDDARTAQRATPRTARSPFRLAAERLRP